MDRPVTDHKDVLCGERDVLRPEDHVPDWERDQSSRPSSGTNGCDASTVRLLTTLENRKLVGVPDQNRYLCPVVHAEGHCSGYYSMRRVVQLSGVDDCSVFLLAHGSLKAHQRNNILKHRCKFMDSATIWFYLFGVK